MTVTAYAATGPSADLTSYQYEPGPPGPLEVDVRVTHCGVCHTDVGLIDDEFGVSRFPVVAGHEAVGIVVEIGTEVDQEKIGPGMRVGVGAVSGSCFACEFCLSGRQQLCPSRSDTAFRGDRGAFAERVRADDWRHVQRIPEQLDSALAAPLLCAGATVFPPFLRYQIEPGDRVAVAGIGGLGHLAVQFAAAWGCETTAITSSASKVDDARALGADDVVVADQIGKAGERFDLVISTVSADLPWNEYLSTLRPRGTLCILGMPRSAISVSGLELLSKERTVAGGVVGSPSETARMLQLAASHGVVPRIERFAVDRINDALSRVRSGEVRYRAVVEF